MKKLFKLKKWLTLVETAQHLSILFDEDVKEADVLRLALDGELKLSVNFVNHAKACLGPVVPIKEAKTHEEHELTKDFKLGKLIRRISGIYIEDGKIFEIDRNVISISGVWDLPMIGSERLDIEHAYQMLTNGPAVTLQSLDGAFVAAPDGNTLGQLLESFDENEYSRGSKASLRLIEERIAREEIEESDAKKIMDTYRTDREEFLAKQRKNSDFGKKETNYYPAGGLPRDSVLVVRTLSLQELESRISEPDKRIEKPIEKRERDTLLVIIGALAEFAKIDLSKPSKAASSIESQTGLMGARIAARTIENHLNRVAEAIENRSQP